MVLKPIVNHSAVHAGSDIVKPHPILNNVITNKECGIVRVIKMFFCCCCVIRYSRSFGIVIGFLIFSLFFYY